MIASTEAPNANTSVIPTHTSSGKAVTKTKAKRPTQPKKKRKRRDKEESRKLHAKIERERTKKINGLVQELKRTMILQGIAVKRDKASVLRAAVETIRAYEAELEQRRAAQMVEAATSLTPPPAGL